MGGSIGGVEWMSEDERQYQARVDLELAGSRLDQVLPQLFPEFSRTRLQQWVRAGRVSCNGEAVTRPRQKLFGGETLGLRAQLEDQVENRPQPIPLDLRYQDDAIIVVNKPAGLVVHPAAGNPDGTLQNALLHFDPGLIQLPRAGIVHRLDKETSGLLVIARTVAAHKFLVERLQAREISREYLAVVRGLPTTGGRVDAPIGRDPHHRTRMAVVAGGKPAVTHYRIEARFRAHAALQVSLESGRTHQIRVHMAHIRYPLVGDPSYGGRFAMPAGASPALQTALRGFTRQALHARRLGLVHPQSGEWVEWSAEPPEDLQGLLRALREDAMDE